MKPFSYLYSQIKECATYLFYFRRQMHVSISDDRRISRKDISGWFRSRSGYQGISGKNIRISADQAEGWHLISCYPGGLATDFLII